MKISETQVSDSGMYICVATNIAGNVTQSVKLSVHGELKPQGSSSASFHMELSIFKRFWKFFSYADIKSSHLLFFQVVLSSYVSYWFCGKEILYKHTQIRRYV